MASFDIEEIKQSLKRPFDFGHLYKISITATGKNAEDQSQGTYATGPNAEQQRADSSKKSLKSQVIEMKGGTAVGGMSASLTLSACTVKTPGISVNLVDSGITQSGMKLGTPGAVTPEDVSITFYNTGSEYNEIRTKFKNVYNDVSNTFGYHLEVLSDIEVESFDKAGGTLQHMKFIGCILTNVGGLNFAYSAGTEVQIFDTNWTYKYFVHKTDSSSGGKSKSQTGTTLQ